jgi:hypothetical protein
MPGVEQIEFRRRHGARFGGVRPMRQFNATSEASPVPADRGADNDCGGSPDYEAAFHRI